MENSAVQTTDESKKKELKIFKVKNSALYCVAFDGGGELPRELKQRWTSPKLAHEAIEQYYEKRAAAVERAKRQLLEEQARAEEEEAIRQEAAALLKAEQERLAEKPAKTTKKSTSKKVA